MATAYRWGVVTGDICEVTAYTGLETNAGTGYTVTATALSNDNYMNLSEDEAYFLCERLIAKVKMHHGDLCLLWHNNRFTPDSYHRSLYTQIINYLAGQ